MWEHVGRFLRRPREQKALALGVRWRKWLPWIPLPIRLSCGSWWLARRNQMGDTLFWFRRFGDEEAELGFMQSFLKPGMVVVDAGAHEGYYTLIASRLVGREGRVISFEPSPRERKALRWHVRLNRCANVHVNGAALGSEQGSAELHVVAGDRTGYNSLKPPAIADRTQNVRVRVETLDDSLRRLAIERVDFLKLDVEGAELSVLQGAAALLQRQPRPVVLAEVEDARTAPWGYRAEEIINALRRRDYEWFQPQTDASLRTVPSSQSEFQTNLVAVPRERLRDVVPEGGNRIP